MHKRQHTFCYYLFIVYIYSFGYVTILDLEVSIHIVIKQAETTAHQNILKEFQITYVNQKNITFH